MLSRWKFEQNLEEEKKKNSGKFEEKRKKARSLWYEKKEYDRKLRSLWSHKCLFVQSNT